MYYAAASYRYAAASYRYMYRYYVHVNSCTISTVYVQ